MDQTRLNTVGNFDQTTINQLAVDTGSLVDAVSAAGALSLAMYTTELTVSGTVAYTLAAPTYAGQRKRIVCVSAASTPLGTVTLTNNDSTSGFACASAFTFTAAGQALELMAANVSGTLKWRAIRVQRAGVQAVTVGTTVLTGLNMAATYNLSVTGTVSSTTTKGIPDGSAVGETMLVGCGTAASTPSGTISLTALTTLGAAGTTLGTFNATTCYAGLMWNGTGWQMTGNTTVVLS